MVARSVGLIEDGEALHVVLVHFRPSYGETAKQDNDLDTPRGSGVGHVWHFCTPRRAGRGSRPGCIRQKMGFWSDLCKAVENNAAEGLMLTCF